MSEMLVEIKALGAKMNEAMHAVHAAQLSNDEIKKSLGGYATTDTVQTAIKAATDASAAAQEIKARLDAVDKTAEWMEKALSRMGSGGDEVESKEFALRARDEMIGYLREKKALSPEVAEATTRALVEQSMVGVTKERRESEVKSLLAGSNPDGGYFIRPERSIKMVQRIFESSPMRQIADIQTTASDSMEFIIDDDEAASGGWVGEVDARPKTDTPKIGKITIPVHEQYANPRATQKMLDDAGFDIESWLSGKVTRKMSRVENTSFVVGNGSQKPKGFIAYGAWSTPGVYQRGALERINSGSAGAFTGDGIKLLQNSLIEEYQANAVFAIKRESWGNIITLKDLDGRYLLDPGSMKNGDTLSLLGKRVMFMHDMPGTAVDADALAYGDFGVGYTIVDRVGFRVIRDQYTDKPYILFYTTKRTGGDVTNYESIKIQRLSA